MYFSWAILFFKSQDRMANNDSSCTIAPDGIHKQWIIKARNGTWQCDGLTVTRDGDSMSSANQHNGGCHSTFADQATGIADVSDFSDGRLMSFAWTANGDLVVRKLTDSKDLYYSAVECLPVVDQADEKVADQARKAADQARKNAEEAQRKAEAEAANQDRMTKLPWEDWEKSQAQRQESGECTPKEPYYHTSKVQVIEEDGVFEVFHCSAEISIVRRGNEVKALYTAPNGSRRSLKLQGGPRGRCSTHQDSRLWQGR
jgi:hypothetical protein